MSEYINWNGELIYAERAAITADNRAFRYGDGLFETIRVARGKVLWLPQHVQRLYHGMELLRMDIPETLHLRALEAEIMRVVKRSRLHEGARIRLNVFRAGKGNYTPDSNQISFAIQVKLAPDHYPSQEGMDIGVFPTHTKPLHALSRLKSANALLYVLAGIYTQEQGWKESLILNDKGHVCEGVSSNVFFVVKGKLITPELSSGCIPGVMRTLVLEEARKLGMEVWETTVLPEILTEADEVLFTNAIQGVQWSRSFENKRYFHKRAEQLQERLNELIGEPAQSV